MKMGCLTVPKFSHAITRKSQNFLFIARKNNARRCHRMSNYQLQFTFHVSKFDDSIPLSNRPKKSAISGKTQIFNDIGRFIDFVISKLLVIFFRVVKKISDKILEMECMFFTRNIKYHLTVSPDDCQWRISHFTHFKHVALIATCPK